ncbi:MAG TPA: sigma-70 family RNA polymerase sigma factor [Caulobacteraceae bacterium]
MSMTSTPSGREADHAAIERLSRAFGRVLIRYFEKRGVRKMDLEDAVQEVFTRLSRREGFSELGGLQEYLFETASSVAVDYHRHRAAQRRSGEHDPYDDDLHAIADVSPEEILAGKQDLQALHRALLELPERNRNIFVLYRLEKMTKPEIARRLGLSLSAVEKNLVRARDHLCTRLGRPA